MATNNISAGSTSNHTTDEIREWAKDNNMNANLMKFKEAKDVANKLRDVTNSSSISIQSINKEQLKEWFRNIGGHEKDYRNLARYLYYRSNILYRIVMWYSGMWDLRCRKIVPKYSMIKDNDKNKFMKSYNDTLDVLDRFNMQTNMVEVFNCVYLEDVYYGLRFTDDKGTFFYRLDPDECIIDSRYSTGDFGFAVDMSKWRSKQRQKIIEYLGSPLKEMYQEYERTGTKYIHCTDKYAVCFKFRTDLWNVVIPPFLPLFLSLASLEDLVDIQAEADALSIYKLIYLPMKVINGSKNSDDFEISPDIAYEYFKKMLDNDAIPANVGAAIVPGDELGVIDFSKSADADINNVEKSQSQILATSGGGAVINSNNITSTAAFNAWLKEETEFAISSLIGQINGATNRWLSYELSNPANVEYFEISVYTKKELADQLLESCKYSYSNRLAYNTFLGYSEKDTMAMEFLENQCLDLPSKMVYPLNSSFTQSGIAGETGQGRNKLPDDELSESGDRMRNQ